MKYNSYICRKRSKERNMEPSIHHDYFYEVDKLYNLLCNNLEDDPEINIQKDVRWGRTSNLIRFDLVVYSNKIPHAIIEIRRSNKNIVDIKKIKEFIFSRTPAALFILYTIDTKDYWISCREFDKNPISTQDIKEVIERIRASRNSTEKTTNKINDISLSETGDYIDPQWARTQISSYKKRKICRYSSLDSLFSTLKYKTLRMNGLPGMNDKTEGLFAWDMIYKSDSTDNQNERRRNDEINNAFIVSFSDENSCDDLTLWRLYGDDAKGVCCEYEIIEEKLRDRFYLGKVKYIDQNSNNDTISDPLLKQFKDSVDNLKLPYIDFSPLIFFYKHKSFEVENEVRLLVDNKNNKNYNNPQYDRNWVLTNSNNIPNPYIDIPLNEIPLKLVKIFLGPNINDADTISSQLETMLEQIGINAEVQLSNIETYRNPSK